MNAEPDQHAENRPAIDAGAAGRPTAPSPAAVDPAANPGASRLVEDVRADQRETTRISAGEAAGPCTVQELAGKLGLTDRTVQLWIRAGCPVLPDGRLDPVDVLRWRGDSRARGTLSSRRRVEAAARVVRKTGQLEAGLAAAGAATDEPPPAPAGEDEHGWRARWERARALTLERELAEMEGTLIPRAEVAALFAARCALLKREIVAAGQKLAPQLVGLQTPAEAAAILAGYARDLLERYSSDHALIRGRRKGKAT